MARPDRLQPPFDQAFYPSGPLVARDVPHSGGFITRRHHDPDNHVHVIQLEVAMGTYMYEWSPPLRSATR